jgi:hypothetical protein
MKFFNIITILFLSQFAVAQTKVIDLKSDKTIYAVSESPILKATLFSKPDNTDYQFDVTATLNGQSIATERVTDYQIFSSPKNLTAGAYTWVVTMVIQDAKYAQDLKTTIKYYLNQISILDAQIATEIDPVVLENLQSRRLDALDIKAAAESELQSIRKPVLAPVQLEFTVQ